jgi:hypothetical protein
MQSQEIGDVTFHPQGYTLRGELAQGRQWWQWSREAVDEAIAVLQHWRLTGAVPPAADPGHLAAMAPTMLALLKRYIALYPGAAGQPRSFFDDLYTEAVAVVQRLEPDYPAEALRVDGAS